MSIFYFYALPVLFFFLGMLGGYYLFRLKVFLLKKYHYRLGFKDGVEKAHYLALITCQQFNIKRIDSRFCHDTDEVQITSVVSFE